MDRKDIRKYQLAQLQILKYTDEICAENHIPYFLMWGTLLGSIRHQGFIPWDPDIDVGMFREDYDKFCAMMMKRNADPKQTIFFDHYETNPLHLSPHAILRIKGTHVHTTYNASMPSASENDGIYIDVFPIDEISPDPLKQKKQVRQLALLQRLIELKVGRIYPENTELKKIAKLCISHVLRLLPLRTIHHWEDQISRRYQHTLTDYVGVLTDPLYYPKQTYERTWFEHGRKASFEGKLYPIPMCTEKILAICYGKYMELPPENERYTYIEDVVCTVDYGPFIIEG